MRGINQKQATPRPLRCKLCQTSDANVNVYNMVCEHIHEEIIFAHYDCAFTLHSCAKCESLSTMATFMFSPGARPKGKPPYLDAPDTATLLIKGELLSLSEYDVCIRAIRRRAEESVYTVAELCIRLMGYALLHKDMQHWLRTMIDDIKKEQANGL